MSDLPASAYWPLPESAGRQNFSQPCARLSADIVAERSYPDHHAFSERDIAALRQAANGLHAQLVTTAKDFVRLPPAARADIEVLEVEVRWPDPDALAGLLAPIVLSARANANPEHAIR